MTWGQGSYVSKKDRATVIRRDKVCQLAFPGCTSTIEELHHPVGLADQGLSRSRRTRPSEVVGVCSHCHLIATKDQQQRGRQRAIKARGHYSRRYRDLEPHPGQLKPPPASPDQSDQS